MFLVKKKKRQRRELGSVTEEEGWTFYRELQGRPHCKLMFE